MIPKAIEPQTDWSAGELNVDAKRTDDPLVKAGARQLSNFRLLNTRKPTNRPGRTAMFPTEGRVDEVTVTAGTNFYLCFGNGTLKIRDASGVYVAGNSGYAWTAATAKSVVWTLVLRSATDRDIVITFPGQRMKLARWSAAAGWAFLDFAFSANAYGASREPFYRLAAPGISLTPGAVSGTVTLVASSSYFVAGMVGTIIRWIGHQIRIVSVTSGTAASGIVIEQLPVTIDLGTITAVKGTFNVGDAISTTTSPRGNYEGEVASVTIAGGVVTGITINMFTTGQQFATSDAIVGPNGTCTAGTVAVVTPGASGQWDEQVMNANRGWPASCSVDQNRLIFCDIPAVPGGIGWSRIGAYDDFLVGANPSDPMFEIAPNRARVYHVINRMVEFVLTDRGIWYIPISEGNPLKPGSVQFIKMSNDSSSSVRPIETTEGIVFINAGLNRVIAIVAKYGFFAVPWGTIETSPYHSHLFKTPVALAVTTGDGVFQERYVYVLNSDGTMAIGKFDVSREWAGWLPWSGTGAVNWISTLGADVIFTTTYTATASVTIAEKLDVTQYLDGGVAINAVPAAMAAGTDPTIQTMLTGTAGTNLTDHAAASAAFDGNTLKNRLASVGKDSPTVGYGNRVYLQPTVGATKLFRIRVTAPLDQPLSAVGATTFNVIGSNDASSWTTVLAGAVTFGLNGEVMDVTNGIDQTNAYLYWGIDISGTSGQAVAVALIEPFYLAAGTVHKSPSLGTGPMWWLAGGQAQVMDGLKTLALHDIDASGNVTAIDAEDLTASTLVAGLGWTATLEPFVPPVQGGADQGQRMKRRRIAKANITVIDSSGFVYAGRRIPGWMAGESQDIAPPLREMTYQFRPRGRSYDPREPLTKDTPGPLTIAEIGLEATV